MRLSGFAVCCAALVSACGDGPTSADLSVPDEATIARLESVIPDMMAEANVPGLAIAIVKDAAVYWSEGFGVASTQTGNAVSVTTVFEAASIGKPVLAYAALQLFESGLIDLDVPLTQYWPVRYVADDPRLDLITTRIVLSHTTGFPNWRESDQLTIGFTPGERFGYSGEGYVYLENVIAYLTERSLNDLAGPAIFGPLEMESSSFAWRPDYETSSATGHNESGETTAKWKPAEPSVVALHSTAEDLARFMAHLMSRYSGNQADPPTIVDLMLTPQVRVNSRIDWGLGMGLQHTETQTSFWHWGDNGTFRGFMVGYPGERLGVVILTNSENAFDIIERIVEEAIGGSHPAFDWLDY